jgi:hypothetical protein
LNNIIVEPYNYRLVEDNGEYYLYVLCGSSSAMYEKKIKIDKCDVDKIKEDNSLISSKADEIRKYS